MADAAESDGWHDLAAGASFHSPVEGYAVHSLDGECCPAVVDKSIFFGTLAFIAAGTAYLVTALLGNAVLNGLDLAALTAAITDAINNGVAAITGIIAAITGAVGKRRRRSLSHLTILFMAGMTRGRQRLKKVLSLVQRAPCRFSTHFRRAPLSSSSLMKLYQNWFSLIFG